MIGTDGRVDAYRLALFQQVIELLPHFQAEEIDRRPVPKPRVAFTVPSGVILPARARDFARRGLGARILSALASADERTLLASPYWSDAGAEHLWDGLARSVELRLPITLAGARSDPERGDLDAMMRLADRLRTAGSSQVTALRYVPPKPYSLFHGKLVCGRVGYLGSANLTGSGLGEHLEAGIPLEEVDVRQVWWLLEVVREAGLLVEQPLSRSHSRTQLTRAEKWSRSATRGAPEKGALQSAEVHGGSALRGRNRFDH